MSAAQGVASPRVALAPEVASRIAARVGGVLSQLVQVPVPASHPPVPMPPGGGSPLAASPATPGLLTSITTASGQPTVPAENPANSVAAGFISNFQAGDPAAMARVLSDANVGLFGLARMYNVAIAEIPGEDKKEHRAAMMDFVKDVASQMQAAGKCSKLEYLAFTNAARDTQTGSFFAYTPPALPATRRTYEPVKPLLLGGQPLKGLPQSLPPGGVDLGRAREAVNAGALFNDIAALHMRLGISAVAASKQAVPVCLQSAEIADSQAMKLTGGQKFGYGIGKFFWSCIAWVPFIFSGGKYHPLDAFEKWKARNVANLDSIAQAVTARLPIGQANPKFSKDGGVDFGDELLNLLAYSPPRVVRGQLKETFKAAIPEGTAEFKEELAGMMADRVYAQLAKESWLKIKSALAEASHSIVRSDSAAVLGRMETDLTDQAVQGMSLWGLQKQQSDLDRLQAHYLKLLPDEAQSASAAPQQDSKAALQARAAALAAKITAELERRTQVAEGFAGQLMSLETGDLADANIQTVTGDTLRRHQATLAALRDPINRQLPDELRGALLGSVDTLNSKIEAELQRRTGAIEADLQKLEAGDFAAITGSELRQRQATLTGLPGRITEDLPEELRGQLQGRVDALNAKMEAELMRRADGVGSFDQALGSLEAGDFAVITEADLGQRRATLAVLTGRITGQLPEELRGPLQDRVTALNGKIATELQRRGSVAGSFAQELRALESGDLEAAKLNLADEAALGRHQGTLAALKERINRGLPEGDGSREDLLATVQRLEARIAAEPARRTRVRAEIAGQLEALEGDPRLAPGDGGIEKADGNWLENTCIAGILNNELKGRIVSELPVALRTGLEKRRAGLVEKIGGELERRRMIETAVAGFNREIEVVGAQVGGLASGSLDTVTQCEGRLTLLKQKIEAKNLPPAFGRLLLSNVAALQNQVAEIKREVWFASRSTGRM